MRFAKMHGLGNDYVYVDGSAEHISDAPALARWLSDRHVGVGSDGLIIITQPEDADADVRMRMYNADGSEGMMCGNGIRCVAKFAVDRGLSQSNPLRVDTRRGVLSVRWLRGADGTVAAATVDMGPPILACQRIPAVVPGVAPDGGGQAGRFPLASGLGAAHQPGGRPPVGWRRTTRWSAWAIRTWCFG